MAIARALTQALCCWRSAGYILMAATDDFQGYITFFFENYQIPSTLCIKLYDKEIALFIKNFSCLSNISHILG